MRSASSRKPAIVHKEDSSTPVPLYTANRWPDEVKKWRAERAKYPKTAPKTNKM